MRALITGASSGIGRTLAIELAKKKYDLVLVARRIDRLNEIKDMFKDNDIIIKQVDLVNQDQLNQLMNELKAIPIDLLINNAGFGKVGFSSKINTAEEITMIDLNIQSLHQLTKFGIEHMDQGKIVNISSMASYLPTPNLASYAATKAYVTSYSEALNYELKVEQRNIQVVTVCPGPVHTEFGQVAGSTQKLKSMPVEKCVKIILNDLQKNKTLIIPGFKMKLLKFLLGLMPKKLILYVSYKVQSKK